MSLTRNEAGWFKQNNFGLFIHYGLYSLLEGSWQGQDTPHLAEWILHDLEIPLDAYKMLQADFTAENLDAGFICRLAKSCGMSYICLTAKHHEGFALFDSQVSDFTSVKSPKCGRDLVQEFQKAAAAEGLIFGLYYSQAQDWEHPQGLSSYRDNSHKDFSSYFRQKCLPQIKELLQNYGPLGFIWLDTPMSMPYELCRELRETIKAEQPHCLISGRIGYGLGDYLSTGDNLLPAYPIAKAWELPTSMNGSWAYKASDKKWRQAEDILWEYLKVLSRGGNYLLNIGPRADGSIPPASLAILEFLAAELAPLKEELCGLSPSPAYIYEQNDFLLATKDQYLYLFLRPDFGENTSADAVSELELYNIANQVLACQCLNHNIDLHLNCSQDLEGHSYWHLSWPRQKGFLAFKFALAEPLVIMEEL